jgi:hypothetical protein
MNRFVILGLSLVLAVEVVALMLLEHRHVLWLSGVVAALVLLEGRRLLGSSEQGAPEPLAEGPAESMQRWIARTESMIRWADSTRADWDRHLRPKLAREFMLATGQRRTKDATAMQATGRIVFGDELWQWVDPSNIALTDRHVPGPGRGALNEILERMERI